MLDKNGVELRLNDRVLVRGIPWWEPQQNSNLTRLAHCDAYGVIYKMSDHHPIVDMRLDASAPRRRIAMLAGDVELLVAVAVARRARRGRQTRI